MGGSDHLPCSVPGSRCTPAVAVLALRMHAGTSCTLEDDIQISKCWLLTDSKLLTPLPMPALL